MVRPMAPLCALLWALLALCSARAAAAVINTGGGGIRGGVRTLVSDWHIILLGCTGIGIFLTIKVRTTCAESEQNTPYMFVDFICLWEIQSGPAYKHNYYAYLSTQILDKISILSTRLLPLCLFLAAPQAVFRVLLGKMD